MKRFSLHIVVLAMAAVLNAYLLHKCISGKRIKRRIAIPNQHACFCPSGAATTYEHLYHERTLFAMLPTPSGFRSTVLWFIRALRKANLLTACILHSPLNCHTLIESCEAHTQINPLTLTNCPKWKTVGFYVRYLESKRGGNTVFTEYMLF